MSYDGLNKYIRITDIDDKTHKFKTNDITSPDIDLTLTDNYLLREGDLLFARTGASVGKTYKYNVTDGKVYYAGFLIRARIKPEYDVNFIFNQTLTKKYNNFINIMSQRSGQPGVNAHEYAEYSFMIPCIKEQNRIGELFEKIDKMIALQQAKLRKIIKTKKAYLSDLFPKEGEKYPNKRFEGFTKSWEQYALGEIAPLRGGYSFQSNNFIGKGVPIVRISNILTNETVGGSFAYYSEQTDDERYLLPHNAAVLAMSGATTGKVSILDNPNNKKVYQNQRVGYFRDTRIVNYSLISTLVKSPLFDWQLKDVLVTGAQPNVSPKEIDSFTFRIPKDKEEQTKIARFFNSLDKKIDLEKQKLNKLEQLKQAYLNELFV